MIFASLVAQLLFISFVSSTASNAPPDGKVLLAAWLDTNDVNGPGSGDRPYKFNSRLGLNISAFQFAQNIPTTMSPEYMSTQLSQLSDNSILYITVYPIDSGHGVAAPLNSNPWPISDLDIAYLAGNFSQLNKQGRRVVMRLAPEMNGYWMPFGCSPTRFLPFWRKVYTAIKAVAPQTDIIWAPNAGNGWPWGRTRGDLLPADFALMDTNGNGQLDAGDDPYSPFYPGDEFVDWIGASVYHFGTTPPYYENTIPSTGSFESYINAAGLYDTYAAKKNKPFSISETGAAFHPEEPPGPGELAIKQAWWQQTITNIDLLTRYPQIKMFCMFEFQKIEGDNGADLRDFRITNNATVLAAFKADFASVQDRYVLATYIPPSSIKNTAGLTPSSSANGAFALVDNSIIGTLLRFVLGAVMF